LAKFATNRRASTRVSRFSRRAMRRNDTSRIGGEAEMRGLRLNDVGDPKPTSPRTVNQSWLKQLTASFNDLVGAGRRMPQTEEETPPPMPSLKSRG